MTSFKEKKKSSSTLLISLKAHPVTHASNIQGKNF